MIKYSIRKDILNKKAEIGISDALGLLVVPTLGAGIGAALANPGYGWQGAGLGALRGLGTDLGITAGLIGGAGLGAVGGGILGAVPGAILGGPGGLVAGGIMGGGMGALPGALIGMPVGGYLGWKLTNSFIPEELRQKVWG